MFDETIILSLGGSLIVPSSINTEFLRNFNTFVRKYVGKGRRFFIVCGGGATARTYIDGAVGALEKKISAEDCDWLGIHATRINAHLLRTIFQDIAHPKIIDKYDRKFEVGDYPVVICAGWKPGWSTDYDAVLLGKQYKANVIVNLSNIEMVYTRDPKKFKDASPIERTSWDYFITLVGDKWTPGLSMPFDPIASQKAKEWEQTVVILKGDNFPNLEKFFAGEKFKGTVIGPMTFDAGFFDMEYFEGKKGEFRGYRDKRLKYFLYRQVNFYRALAIKLALNPKRVLDVGCGFGLMVRYFRQLGIEAYGVDISNYAVSMTDDKEKTYIKRGDILKIPFEDNSFDLVVTYDVLEHIPYPKIERAIAECMRVSSRHCLHKIFTKENKWIKLLHGDDLSHVSVFTRKWWFEFFQKHHYELSSRFFLHLPYVMESIFLLEK